MGARDARPAAVEWPTIAVAAAIYAGYGLLTWHHETLPWWLVALLGGGLLAWHGSLQHEVVHGHPTRRAALNEALIFPSLWLWMPWRLYRNLHLRHHCNEMLTEPGVDPESYYLAPAQWGRRGPHLRVLLRLNNSLAGRLALGPPIAVARLWSEEARRFARGDRSHLRAWVLHGAGCGLVVAWVHGVCAVPAWEYAALYVWPGLSLTLLRSFAEHQARPAVAHRTTAVEAGPVLSLLYLNNNLHPVHHAEPGLPWYGLPARWRADRGGYLAENGGHRYAGYTDVARRFLLRAREPVVHPLQGPGPGAGLAPPVGGPAPAPEG